MMPAEEDRRAGDQVQPLPQSAGRAAPHVVEDDHEQPQTPQGRPERGDPAGARTLDAPVPGEGGARRPVLLQLGVTRLLSASTATGGVG